MNIPIVDTLLNRITMYRLVLYYLALLIIVAAGFGVFGILPYSAEAILYSTAILTAICWIVNELCARLFKVTPNIESVYITAFILALIITPVAPSNLDGLPFLVIAGALAMVSKYVLAYNKKHIFNPAALAVVITGVVLGNYASWWVGGTLSLAPLVLVGGLLIVRKVQRFDLFLSFAAVALVATAVQFLPQNPAETVWQTLLHSSLLFMGTIMLTEPYTTPPQRMHRIIYGVLVGILFTPGLHIGSFYTSPELALVVGNLYVYAVSPKGRYVLKLIKSEEVADGVWDFAFTPDKPIVFKAGQYLEWTLGHQKPDARGNRRYFTISSSPSQQEIYLGVKMYESPSTFKQALKALKPGDTITAGQLAGEFTLPNNPKEKFVFIAGGIGVTPFCSIVQDMMDTKDKRSAVLLYSNKTEKEIAYKDFFDQAHAQLGMKTVYWVTNEMGFMDAEYIKREVPDYQTRTFYISGPHSMVVAFESSLKKLGVPRSRIKVDFFPGFV